MLMFDTPETIVRGAGPVKKVIWIEPNYVVAVEPTEYTTAQGRTLTALVKTLVGDYTVLDPNGGVARQIASEKAKRAAEMSTIIATFLRPGRRTSDIAQPSSPKPAG